MKKASIIMIKPVFIIGLFVSISSLLWLALYFTSAPTEALLVMGSVLAGMALQVAAYIGARRFKEAAFWPGLCMVAAGPATLWNAFAGPGALYGVSSEILSPESWKSLPPLYYVAIPPMVAGILVCIAFVIAGLLSLSADFAGMGEAKEKKQSRQRLMDMQPTAPAKAGHTKVIATRGRPRKGGAPPPADATRPMAPVRPGAAGAVPTDDENAAAQAATPIDTDAPPTPQWTPVTPHQPIEEEQKPTGAVAWARDRVKTITQTLRLSAIRSRQAGETPPEEAKPAETAKLETAPPAEEAATEAPTPADVKPEPLENTPGGDEADEAEAATEKLATIKEEATPEEPTPEAADAPQSEAPPKETESDEALEAKPAGPSVVAGLAPTAPPEASTPEGAAPESQGAPGPSIFQRAASRVRSVTQTLRLSAIRGQQAGQPPAPPEEEPQPETPAAPEE